MAPDISDQKPYLSPVQALPCPGLCLVLLEDFQIMEVLVCVLMRVMVLLAISGSGFANRGLSQPKSRDLHTLYLSK